MRRDDQRLEIELEERELLEAGLLEPGQPTLAAHIRHREKMEAPFSARERAAIRSLLFVPGVE